MKNDNQEKIDNIEQDLLETPDTIPLLSADSQPSIIDDSKLDPIIPSTIESTHASTSGSGLIVLQWLTYAFWGWTVFAASILTANVIAYFITPTSNNDFTAYATAAVLVLLPISITCDIFYTRQEPKHKTGAASVIMIIHAVLFALFGIAAFIAIVFSLVQLMISSSDSTNTMIALYSEIIIVILYALIFLRTLLPSKLINYRNAFHFTMIIIIGLISIFGFIGPVSNAQITRDDKLVDSNLNIIKEGIERYVVSNNQLPDSLNKIEFTGDAKKIIDRNLVLYNSNSKPKETSESTFNSTTTYFYQLCVNYKQEIKDNNGSIYYDSSTQYGSDGYGSYIYTGSHPAGNYCYNIVYSSSQKTF